MTLAPGTRLGPYEVVALVGSGGMGEVYTARDTRLDRIVAIKVSKEQFSERFEREARAIAALNHPNICHLYDVGPDYLVMEYVDGHPVRPGLPVRQLLDLAAQIADGLAAAHAAGVVHRDLKPSNILVTPTGHVKILDFGLAVMGPRETGPSDVTRGGAVTERGATVGTTAYMSPEQARGEALDGRTDLWSLGVVLYEMATGVRPFDGPTSAVIFEAILGRAPVPVRERKPALPADVERVIDRLLEKDPATRYQSAADVRADLRRIARDSAAHQPVQPRVRSGSRKWRGVVVAAAISAAVIAGVVAWRAAPFTEGPVTSPSEYVQLTHFTDSVFDPALSPDGRMVTFVRGAPSSGFPPRGDIYVKLLPNGESVRLTDSPTGKYAPVFTPDGSRVAYTQVTRRPDDRGTWDTWTVPIAGGEPTQLLPNAAGLIWIDDRYVLFSEIKGTGLHMGIVTATTSRDARREVYFPGHERAMAHYSYLSPDRQWVLIVEMDRTALFQQCRLAPFDGSSAGRQVGPAGACTAAAWSPDGRWMYFSVFADGASHLWRQRVGDSRPEQITFGPTEETGVAVAPDGRSIVTSVGQQRSAIWIHDAGIDRQLSIEGVATWPSFSRDGRQLYFILRQHSLDAVSELRSLDLASGRIDRLLPDRSVRQYDVSKDDLEVVFTVAGDDGVPEIWLAPVDRSAAPRRIVRGGDQPSFDGGSGVIFRSLENRANYLTRIGKDGTGRERLLETPILNKLNVSPDGGWAAAVVPGTGESATPAVVAVSLRGGALRRLCFGCQPAWSSDGRWLYVTLPDRPADAPQMIAIPLTSESLPQNVEPIVLAAREGRMTPGTVAIARAFISPGPSPSTYAFATQDVQRNLFRIPLH